jgi:hypothetical protein
MKKHFLLLTFFLLLISCIKNPAGLNNPEITITYPPDGTIVRDTVKILTEVVDNIEIKKVEFYIDGALLFEDTDVPYTYHWIIQAQTGWHTILAKAYDNQDNCGLSNIVNVQILDTTDTESPEIAIISPAGWSVVDDTVLIRTEVSDNRGISRVVFFVDGDSINTDITEPFQCLWNTRPLTNDYHTIIARAYDFAQNWTNAMVTVYVENLDTIDTEPPQIAIISPAGWSTVSETVLVRTEASDNRGVSKVVFYIDGDSIYTDLFAPFNYAWNSRSVSNNYHTILAKAFDPSQNWANAMITVLVQNP